jgi:hypothetical protein
MESNNIGASEQISNLIAPPPPPPAPPPESAPQSAPMPPPENMGSRVDTTA